MLRRLLTAGVRHNVLLMDQVQYSAALQSDPPRFAGRRYTLVPIRIPGAFHPKVIFLAGKQKGLIAIGSHNLTLAGFGFNRELTNLLRISGDSDPQALVLARHVWDGVCGWLELVRDQVPSEILDMAYRVKHFAPWLDRQSEAEATTSRILAAQPGGESLWRSCVG